MLQIVSHAWLFSPGNNAPINDMPHATSWGEDGRRVGKNSCPLEMGRVGHLSFIQTNYTSILPHEWGNGIDHDKIDKSPPSPPRPQVGGVGPTIDNNSTGIIL